MHSCANQTASTLVYLSEQVVVEHTLASTLVYLCGLVVMEHTLQLRTGYLHTTQHTPSRAHSEPVHNRGPADLQRWTRKDAQ